MAVSATRMNQCMRTLFWLRYSKMNAVGARMSGRLGYLQLVDPRSITPGERSADLVIVPAFESITKMWAPH